MKAIIIAGGTPPAKNLILKELTADTIIIAADSGANCLKKYKITPNYLIGDFDSIDSKTLAYFTKNNSVSIERYPSDKNLTDSQLALKKARELKVKEIVFLGCFGGKRVDHLLSVFGLLAECLNSDIDAVMKDEYQIIKLLKKSTTVFENPGTVFSLQAYGTTVKNLTIIGGKYPLNNYSLKTGDTLTLSNEFLNKKIEIKFASGSSLLIIINS